jgi:hypothetical protein
VLRATAPSGEPLTAFLDLPEDPEPLPVPAIDVARWPLGVAEVTDADLQPNRRARQRTEPLLGACARDDLLRLEADLAPGARARWMSTDGSFLELDEARTEWTPGTLTLDEGEIEAARTGQDGVVSWVTLALDDTGRTSTALTDQGVGQALGGQARLGQRWIPIDQALEGWVRATLAPDPRATGGLALVDAEPAPAPDPDQEDPYGWAGRCAAEAAEPWHPDTLARALCATEDLDGARVLVWVQP